MRTGRFSLLKKSTPRWQAKIDHRTKALRAKRWLGKKMTSMFLPNHFFAPELLTSKTLHGLCARGDF
jgi:hypothetical protein